MRTFPPLAALVVVAACGGADRLTKGEYVAQADAICARYEERLAELEDPRTLRDVPAYLEEGIPLARRELAELEKLKPPEEDEAAIERLLVEVEKTVVQLERLRAAAAARDRESAEQASAAVEASGERAAALARDYGLTACGSA